MPVICSKCKNYYRAVEYGVIKHETILCNRLVTNLISGTRDYINDTCYNQRYCEAYSVHGYCGEEGKYYEEKK